VIYHALAPEERHGKHRNNMPLLKELFTVFFQNNTINLCSLVALCERTEILSFTTRQVRYSVFESAWKMEIPCIWYNFIKREP